jgi:hypothetical protein
MIQIFRIERQINMSNLAEVSLFAGGIFNLGFTIFHLFFWKLFDWKKDLASLTPINRSVMQILNLCLTFMILVMSYVSLFLPQEMLTTSLGKSLLVAFALFWFLRMLEQIFVFEVKGSLSFVFTLIFLLGSIFYVIPAMY